MRVSFRQIKGGFSIVKMAFSANGRKIAKDHQTVGFHQEGGDWDLAKAWFDNPDTTLPARYTAPLWHPNREAEMTTAWRTFNSHGLSGDHSTMM